MRPSVRLTRLVLILVFCTLAIWIPTLRQSVAAHESPSFEQCIAAIRARETETDNIRIFAVIREQQEQQPNEWVDTPVLVELEAVLSGGPNGKVRFDVKRDVLRWYDGNADYSERQLTVAFNGRAGKIIEYAGGIAGKVTPQNTASVMAQRPRELQNYLYWYAAGAKFDAQMWDLGIRSLTEYLEAFATEARGAGGTVNVGIAEDVGPGVVSISIGKDPFVRKTWWFDPNRDWSLLKHEFYAQGANGQLELKEADEVTNVAQQGGSWLPVEAYHYYPREEGKPHRRLHWNAKTATRNETALSDAVFDPPIPDNYSVQDLVNGRIVERVPAPEKLEPQLSQQVNEAISFQQQLGPRPSSAKNSSWDLRWIGVTLLVACGVALAAVGILIRARRSVPSVALLITCAAFAARSGAAEPSGALPTNSERPPILMAETIGFQDNCAVNVTFATLQVFQRKSTLVEVSDALGAGPYFERERNLGHIRACFKT